MIIKKSYESPYTKSVSFQEGEQIIIQEKDSQWQGWKWCTASDGRTAWIPESYLIITEKSGRLNRDYNSREFNVEPGEEYGLIQKESGWAWCLNEKGEKGWIPMECFE